ncbi:hypothetical protein Tco_0277183 [Tanacetum coccineum]
MFQQHQDESLYDAWTRYKDLIRKVPHHGLSLWSQIHIFFDHIDRYTQIDINYAAGGNLKGLSAEEAWETIEDYAQCDKQWKNPTSTISDQTIKNLRDHLVGNEVVRVKIPKCKSWLDAYDEPIEVEETLGTSMEVEPLEETQLEDLGLNTYNHDIPLSSREVPIFDELEPQPQPLPNCPSLDASLGNERGPEPPSNHLLRIVLG